MIRVLVLMTLMSAQALSLGGDVIAVSVYP